MQRFRYIWEGGGKQEQIPSLSDKVFHRSCKRDWAPETTRDEMRLDGNGGIRDWKAFGEWSRKPPSRTHRLGWFSEISVAAHLRVLPGLLHASQLSVADAARHGQGRRHGRISLFDTVAGKNKQNKQKKSRKAKWDLKACSSSLCRVVIAFSLKSFGIRRPFFLSCLSSCLSFFLSQVNAIHKFQVSNPRPTDS